MADRDEILRALKHVEAVPAGAVKAVAVDHETVRVTLSVGADRARRRAVREAVAQALMKLEGVVEVGVAFATPAPGGPQGGRSPTGPIDLCGVKDIIAVGAGKGGVGKSTLAVHLAVGLRRRQARVGLLDADVYGPSVATMVGAEGARAGVTEQDRIRPIDAAGLKVISMANFVRHDAAMIWRGPMVHGAVRQLLGEVDWGQLDYLFVDLPPGTGDVPLTLAQSVPVTGAVVVTTPQPVALNDALRAAKMYQQLGIVLLGLVENMSYFVCSRCGAEHDLFGRGAVKAKADELNLRFLGEMPLSPAIRVNTDSANVDADFEAASGVAEAVQGVVDDLIRAVEHRRQTQPPPRPLAVRQQ